MLVLIAMSNFSVYTGLIVNAKVVANRPNKNNNITHETKGEIKTFLGVITIKRFGLNMVISPLQLKINGELLDWTNGTTFRYDQLFH